MPNPINRLWAGKHARLRYGGTLLLPVDNVEFGASGKLIERITTANYGEWKGPYEVTYEPRANPSAPDLVDLPATTAPEIAKRNAFLGTPALQIWGGIRRGEITISGFFYGGNRTPRIGNLAALLLYHTDAGLAPMNIPVMFESVKYTDGVRGFKRFLASGKTHGDFDPYPFGGN
jgi:hypothetical protein